MNKLSPLPSIGMLPASNFDLRQARAFVFVADELHFGRAASRLFVSQPSISRSVRNLEESLGVTLLERSTRRVRLTVAGSAFAEECRLAFGHLNRAVSAAHSASEGNEGLLRVGYMDFAVNGRLPTILQNFRADNPRIAIELLYLPTAMQHAALLDGRIDIGFMIGEFHSPNVSNMLVAQEDFVALLPERHRLASAQGVRLSDLREESFIVGDEASYSSFRARMFAVCQAAGFFPKIVQQAPNTSGILGLVAAGMGVALMGGSARNLSRAGVVVKTLSDVTETISTSAVWVSGDTSPVLNRFTKALVRHMHTNLVKFSSPSKRSSPSSMSTREFP